MRQEYRAFYEIKETSGFGWSTLKNTIVATDELWNLLVQNKPKFKHFRDRGCKWDFEKLSIIIGNDHATGSYAQGGLDSETVVHDVDEDCNNDQPRENVEESVNDTDEGVDQTSTNPSSSVQKRQHRKKTMIDDADDWFIRMDAKVDLMVESINPMTFVKQLHEQVMQMEGFSSTYLNRAFEMLRRDVFGAEIFLARKTEYRKEMLEEMRDKIETI
ncbi:Myb/SANT-like domain [Macleaya cordata]|nr:Myb/SANT-like domain [Macleaya cordata]